MEILHACPAGVTTGGPEAIHEFVSELNKNDGVHARILYWNVKDNHPQPDDYALYHCEYVTELPENYDGILIVPEIWAHKLRNFPECKKAIYWLGVDAYANWTPANECGSFLEDSSIVHIAQSEYAYDFLRRLGVKRIVQCTDYLNAEFYADYDEPERSNLVLYNPAKASQFTYELIGECEKNDISFQPIAGMTREEVIDTMHRSKLYIDFGDFPGRERMPREAVLCGCCIITSKIGSAAYNADFTHDYKFERKSGHIWAIIRQIQKVLDNYDMCRKDFDRFRMILKLERGRVATQCRKVIKALDEI